MKTARHIVCKTLNWKKEGHWKAVPSERVKIYIYIYIFPTVKSALFRYQLNHYPKDFNKKDWNPVQVI